MRSVSLIVIVAAPLLVAWAFWRRTLRRIEPFPPAVYHTHWMERIAGCGRTLHVQQMVSLSEAFTYEKSLQRRLRFATPPFVASVSIHLWSPYSSPTLTDSFLENIHTHLGALQWTAGPLGAVVELHYETSTCRGRAILSSKPSDSSRTRLLPPCAA